MHMPRAGSLFQSEKKDVYGYFGEKLIDAGFAFRDEQGAIFFDIRCYIERRGPSLTTKDHSGKHTVIDLNRMLEQGSFLKKENGSSFCLISAEGRGLFHLAAVVDDDLYGITHVVRGVDLRAAQIYQDLIRRSLDMEEPEYIYTPMLMGGDDTRYWELIRQGIPQKAIVSYMISSGYGDPDAVYENLDDAAKEFDIRKIHSASSKFDARRLEAITRRLLRERTISPEQRVDVMAKFLKANGDETLAHEVAQSEIFQTMIKNEQRTIQELADYIGRTLLVSYDSLPRDTAFEVERICKMLMVRPDLFEGRIYPPDMKEILGAMALSERDIQPYRWIVLGGINGMNPAYATNYLSEKRSLQERVRSALSAVESFISP